ncbi:MAG: manganese efflux pump [Defluviitaleaceae bacterium]|nr:manganese efflux pump [Defluviitaleaceae bacterium]
MAIFMAIALSIDALGMGISCGLRRQKIGLWAYVILFTISMLVMAASVFFGNFIASFLAEETAGLIASIWIISLGSWIALGALRKNQTDGEEISNNKITKKGAVQLALVLSIDSLGAGLAAASLGITIYILPILVAAFQIGFLALGMRLTKLLKPKSSNQRLYTVIAGLILVSMGIVGLV